MKISSVLKVGDTVYSSANCKPMKVARVYSTGFETEDDYFSYEEHRNLFWLTKRCCLEAIQSRQEGASNG
jgi:hypothetical protein